MDVNMDRIELDRGLCQWCRDNAFDSSTLRLLEIAYNGERRRALVEHSLSNQPSYFWTSSPTHSGYGRTFQRHFQLVKNAADSGCVFCSLLITAVRESPPEDPSRCIFEGPLQSMDGLDETISAKKERHVEAMRRVRDYLDRVGPDWAQHSTYGDIIRGAIEAGLPPESQFLSFKVMRDTAKDLSMPDFAFTILFNEPWEFSTICWPYELPAPGFGVDFGNCYFRIYLKEPYEGWERFNAATDKKVLKNMGETWDEAGSQRSSQDISTRDARTFRALIEDCIENHRTCKSYNENNRPSRLLQLAGPVASPSVNLVNGRGVAISAPYACLSYCWGGPQPQMTVASRLECYSQNIPFAEMPRTIQDAVKFVLGLGLEHLWVDSYCIIQDSDRDVTTELRKMSSIFNGSYCTIAAMSGKASVDGIFGGNGPMEHHANFRTIDIDNDSQKSGSALCPTGCAIVEVRKDFQKPNDSDHPLLTRAWTLQEILLSPRLLILHSDGQQPVLRCASRAIRSDGGFVPHVSSELSVLHRSDLKLEDRYGVPASSARWYTILQQYTQRFITDPLDKLPALIGIVAEFELDGSLGTYMAGLWSNTFKRDLLWEVNKRDPLFNARQEPGPRATHDIYVGPSWSWVSRNHAIFYSNDFDPLEEAKILAYGVVPTNPALPNGALKSAKITISCPALEVDVPDDWTDLSENFSFDDNPRPLGIGKMWLLQVMAEEPYNTRYPVGLGVVEIGQTPGETRLCKRIGMFRKGAGRERDYRRKWPELMFSLI